MNEASYGARPAQVDVDSGGPRQRGREGRHVLAGHRTRPSRCLFENDWKRQTVHLPAYERSSAQHDCTLHTLGYKKNSIAYTIQSQLRKLPLALVHRSPNAGPRLEGLLAPLVRALSAAVFGLGVRPAAREKRRTIILPVMIDTLTGATFATNAALTGNCACSCRRMSACRSRPSLA